MNLALDTLSHSGQFRLHLDSLIEAMPVSKGSFYHHFKGKPQFLRALVHFWSRTSTDELIEFNGDSEDAVSARERLWELVWNVTALKLFRFEKIMSNLALESAELAELVAETKSKRLRYVRRLFRQAGFVGIEEEIRAQACVALMENALCDDCCSEIQQKTRLQAYFDLLTRP